MSAAGTGSSMETFVVRLWRRTLSPKTGPLELHGVVEHLGTGHSGTFSADGELVAFLRGRSWEEADRLGEGKAS